MPRPCLAPLLFLALLPGVSQGRFEPDLISQNGHETHLASVPRGADDLVLMHEIVRLTRFDAAGSVLGEEQHTQDGNGNRIQEADYRLFWDSFDRLVRVERASDGVIVGRYRYDALGRRVDRSFVAQGEVASQQVFHVHDGAREVEELDAAGNVQADFVWGGMYVDELVQLRRGGQAYYTHSSSIYSVAALSDAGGSVVERYAYRSIYGVCQVQDGAGAPKSVAAEVGNPWRFQGRRFDPETGFYHFRARQLDPKRGRFVSRDPLGLWGDPGQVGNSYSFAGNDPVNRVDPLGLDDWDELPWYGKGAFLLGGWIPALIGTAFINGASDNNAPPTPAPVQPPPPPSPPIQMPGIGGVADNGINGAFEVPATRENMEAIQSIARTAQGVVTALRATLYVTAAIAAVTVGGAPLWGVLWNQTRGLLGYYLSPTRIGRLFFDPRKFKSISRAYWALRGGAFGRSLHHWLIPQRASWAPSWLKNAGWNLINLPGFQRLGIFGGYGLNQWMGFAARWGGWRAWAAIGIENAIRVIIPASAYGAFRGGQALGSGLIDVFTPDPDGPAGQWVRKPWEEESPPPKAKDPCEEDGPR